MAGRPQLALPQFDDQFDNANAVATAGAGRCLSPQDCTSDLVAEACPDLMWVEQFRTVARRVAADMAAVPPLVEAVSLLEKLVS